MPEELHAEAPDDTTPASDFAARMALARAAKKAKPPEAEEGATQLPVEKQKITRPKPRRKIRRKGSIQKLVTLQKQSKHLAPGELDGITTLGCPVACHPERCVITGENVCGHPAKGGLQAKYLQMSPVLSRFNQARQELARLEAEKKKAK